MFRRSLRRNMIYLSPNVLSASPELELLLPFRMCLNGVSAPVLIMWNSVFGCDMKLNGNSPLTSVFPGTGNWEKPPILSATKAETRVRLDWSAAFGCGSDG